MKVGETKLVEWVRHQEPLGPHRKLAQEPRVLFHHNHYSVLTEHVKEEDNGHEGIDRTKGEAYTATRSTTSGEQLG